MFKVFFSCLIAFGTLSAGTIDVEKYSSNSNVQWIWAVTSLKHLELNGDETILDVGSGDGKITALLASKVPQGSVVGVDAFPELIEFAQVKHQAKNLSFELMSGAELAFNNQFDVTTSFLTLNWLTDAEAESAIRGIAQALKSGGVGLFTIPAPAKNEAFRQIFLDMCNSDLVKPYLSLFEYQNRGITEEKIQSWVADAGLTLEFISVEETTITHHDRYEVQEWFLGVNPRLSQMPQESLDYFTEEYIRLISMIYPQAGDGRIYAFPEKMVIKVSKS
jgi:trans-aconitate methyltransferase